MAAEPVSGENFPLVAISVAADDAHLAAPLLDTFPRKAGIAFLLLVEANSAVPEPSRSMFAELTSLTTVDGIDGLTLAPDHLYVCRPGTALRMTDIGLVFEVSPESTPRSVFDRLIYSISETAGHPFAMVILSQTANAGDDALAAAKAAGALIIRADPFDASASPSGDNQSAPSALDLILPIASIPETLAAFAKAGEGTMTDGLRAIVDFVSAKSSHDFGPYRFGTLRRRIEQRMLLSKFERGDTAAYLAHLRENDAEQEHLAKAMLINVTGFFRDPKVFDLLARTVIPSLVRAHGTDEPLRVWSAGCSTGEEAYSLAILFLEAIAADGRAIKLQVFASDLSADAVATAREGHYPDAIEAAVSTARLQQYFVRDEHGYRVNAELRNVVVFTVHDLLADPPFPRIDLISCRNVLIYLMPAAQAKVLSQCRFALRDKGLLLLGSAEAIGEPASGFETVAKAERLFRKVEAVGENPPPRIAPASLRARVARMTFPMLRPREAVVAQLARRLVLEMHAPASVLIDREGKCLYSIGPTSRFLQVASGYPTTDLLDMVPPELRAKLRLAIDRVANGMPRVMVTDNRLGSTSFSIDVRAADAEGEGLMLVAFIEDGSNLTGALRRKRLAKASAGDLERELAATRKELQLALEALEKSRQQQKEINEDALAVTAEYESTNDELLTSEEELQALNEELTVLNAQLHDALERQRSTSDDLQNVLYSTDVATLCLDAGLRIRFFTPAIGGMFAIIDSDIGRPLADLRPLSGDERLIEDCRAVLGGALPIECELELAEGRWVQRNVLPFHTHERRIDGVVITFADITERKQAKRILILGKQQAEAANIAKSRFLAAASHDLRQPLQSLNLLQALLAQTVKDEESARLIDRFGQTLDDMTGMLNVLLDINQIEAGVVQTDKIDFPIESMFARLRAEFSPLAQAQRLDLRIPHCGLRVHSDPRLLEQMIRNLLANAIKYTREGGVLLGCRRDEDRIRLEVWDTGIGIAETDLRTIFDEFHQVDNSARELSKGLGLGLSIVHRLGTLLGHDISVRSLLGKGSVFSVRVPAAGQDDAIAPYAAREPHAPEGPSHSKIIVIEDDPDVRDLLELLLTSAGHLVRKAETGDAALAMIADGAIRPDLVLADFNLPGSLDGLGALAEMRRRLDQWIPGIILTGAISKEAQAIIADHDCRLLTKPVKPAELMNAINGLIGRDPTSHGAHSAGTAVVYVIDGQAQVRASIREVLGKEGLPVDCFPDAETFLAAHRAGSEGCLLTNATLPGMSGMDLLVRLREMQDPLPTIMMTASSDVNLAVTAMKAGACDFIEKPVSRAKLLASIAFALEQAREHGVTHAQQDVAARQVADLTPRQYQVMERVLAGQASKVIAADLGISQRTVEHHRAAIMRIMNAKSLPELARAVLAADKRIL